MKKTYSSHDLRLIIPQAGYIELALVIETLKEEHHLYDPRTYAELLLIISKRQCELIRELSVHCFEDAANRADGLGTIYV